MDIMLENILRGLPPTAVSPCECRKWIQQSTISKTLSSFLTTKNSQQTQLDEQLMTLYPLEFTTKGD